jgi:hypothetical protein
MRSIVINYIRFARLFFRAYMTHFQKISEKASQIRIFPSIQNSVKIGLQIPEKKSVKSFKGSSVFQKVGLENRWVSKRFILKFEWVIKK